MTQTLSGLGLTGLGDLGIGVPKSTGGATTQDAKDGKLTIDTDKLGKAIAADYTKVRELFAGKGATKGISGDALGLRGHADRHAGHDHRPDDSPTTPRSRASPTRSPSSTPVWRRSRSA